MQPNSIINAFSSGLNYVIAVYRIIIYRFYCRRYNKCTSKCLEALGGNTKSRCAFMFFFAGAILIGCVSTPATPLAPSPAGVTRIPQIEPEETVPSTETNLATEANLATPELIDAALARREITTGQRLLYLTYAIYEPESLPQEFRSIVPWRGTMVVREIKQYAASKETFCTLAPDIQREIRRLIPESVSCSQ